VVGERLADGVGHGPGDSNHRGQVSGRRVHFVGNEDLVHEITVVLDGHTGGLELLDEPAGPQGGRRLVLSGMMRPSAAGHSDQGHRTTRHRRHSSSPETRHRLSNTSAVVTTRSG
jgi:hypothetical protein